MSDSVFQDKHILITGASGFLGRHVVARLSQTGAILHTPRSMQVSLTETGALLRWVRARETNLDLIIHLAGQTGGIESVRTHPHIYLDHNARMALEIASTSAMLGCPVVAAGSVCAYPRDCPVPMSEYQLWDGKPEATNFPYGEAKRLLLAALEANFKQYGIGAVYLASANLYGPGDHFDSLRSHVVAALIPKFVEAALDGWQQVTVWGTGRATRDFLYVEDAAAAYQEAAHYLLTYPQDYVYCNIGSGTEVAISYLAQELAMIAGFDGNIVYDTSKPDGQPRRCLDITLVKHKLGWKPETPLRYGLHRTLDWYKAFGPPRLQTPPVGWDRTDGVAPLRPTAEGREA